MVRKINPGGPSRLYSSWLKGNLVIAGGDVGPGNEYFVAKTGSDNNDGLSWERAKLTVQAALDLCVSTGETVYVAHGTYTETLTTPLDATATYGTLCGVDSAHPMGESPKLTSASTSAATLTVRGRGWRIMNLYVDAPTAEAAIKLDAKTAGCVSAFTVIENCNISWGKYGIDSYGGPGLVTVRNNLFNFLTETGAMAITATDASASQPNVWLIENNNFVANLNHICFTNADGPFNATIRYNTFHGDAFGVTISQKCNLGNGGGYNNVYANFMGGTFSHAGGYQEGATGDNWYGNYTAAGIDSVTLPA